MCLIKFTFFVYDWTFITDGIGYGVNQGKKVTTIDTVQHLCNRSAKQLDHFRVTLGLYPVFVVKKPPTFLMRRWEISGIFKPKRDFFS